jgi:hypothetical protein
VGFQAELSGLKTTKPAISTGFQISLHGIVQILTSMHLTTNFLSPKAGTRKNETDFKRGTIVGWAPRLGGLAKEYQLA